MYFHQNFQKYHILKKEFPLTENFPVAKKGRGQRAVGVNYLTHILLVVHRKTPASEAAAPHRPCPRHAAVLRGAVPTALKLNG